MWHDINCSQIYETEGPSGVNQESPTPFNFPVVETRDVPVQLGLSTLPQQNNIEPSTAPKLGYNIYSLYIFQLVNWS